MKPPDELVNYIRQCLEQNMTEADIRLELFRRGWPDPIVDAAWSQLPVTRPHPDSYTNQ